MILSRPKLYAAQRLDLEDMLTLLSSASSDEKYKTKEFWANSQFIFKGFAVSSLGSPSPALVDLTDATLINANNSGDFSWFVANSGASPISVPLTSNSRNYLELELSTLDGTPLTKAFWQQSANAGEGSEFQQNVNTITNIQITVQVLTGGFSGSANRVPLAIVDTDSGNNIKLILDKRDLFFRLGSAASAIAGYSWVSQNEPEITLNLTSESGTFTVGETVTIGAVTAKVTTGGTSTIGVITPSSDAIAAGATVTGGTSGATGTLSTASSSFTGADKSIGNLRDSLSALMSEIRALKGTDFWFQSPAGSIAGALNLINTFLAPSSTASVPILSWDGSVLKITDRNASPGGSDVLGYVRNLGSSANLSLCRQDGTASTSTISIPDGSLVFVQLPSSGSRTYSGIGTGSTNYQIITRSSFVVNDKNFWIGYREGSKLVLRDNLELNAGEQIEIGYESFDQNPRLIEGGIWSFNSGTNQLSWTEDAFISIPGVSKARNTLSIGSSPLTLSTDGQVAYVNLNRASGSNQILTITIADTASVPPGDNILIIARRVNINSIIAQDSTDNNSVQIGGVVTKYAQPFALTTGRYITDVKVRIAKGGSPAGNYTLSVVKDDGTGKPSSVGGDIIATVTAANSTLTSPSNDVTLAVGSSQLAGTYWIVLTGDSTYFASFSSSVTFIGLRTDPFASSNYAKYFQSPNWVTQTGFNFYFTVDGVGYNYISVGHPSFRLIGGESRTLGQGTSIQNLAYIGATDTSSSSPSYSSTSSGSLNLPNYNTTSGEDLTTRLSKITAMLADLKQDENLRFDSGTVTWDGTNVTVTGASLSIPGTTIGASAVSINALGSTALADGSCLYVDISRTSTSALTLTSATISSITPSQQRLILFRNIGGNLWMR